MLESRGGGRQRRSRRATGKGVGRAPASNGNKVCWRQERQIRPVLFANTEIFGAIFRRIHSEKGEIHAPKFVFGGPKFVFDVPRLRLPVPPPRAVFIRLQLNERETEGWWVGAYVVCVDSRAHTDLLACCGS